MANAGAPGTVGAGRAGQGSGRVGAGHPSARGVAFYMSEGCGLPGFGDQSPRKPTLTLTWTSWGGESPHRAPAGHRLESPAEPDKTAPSHVQFTTGRHRGQNQPRAEVLGRRLGGLQRDLSPWGQDAPPSSIEL